MGGLDTEETANEWISDACKCNVYTLTYSNTGLWWILPTKC